MLKKLLKYDLMWINKNLIYFYAIAFIFAISGRLLSLIDNSMLASVISKICFGITISFVINAIVNGIIRSWVRFINNCYKDESYLTHTLPVTKKEIYLSKFIASIITMAVGVIISIISLAICYLSADFIESIKQFLNILEGQDIDISLLIILFSILLILEFIFIISIGYFGIILGHKYNNNRFFKSVLYGFGAFIITNLITLLLIVVLGLFNDNVKSIIFDSNSFVISNSLFITLLVFSICCYIVYIIAYLLFNSKEFNKGVNVD